MPVLSSFAARPSAPDAAASMPSVWGTARWRRKGGEEEEEEEEEEDGEEEEEEE